MDRNRRLASRACLALFVVAAALFVVTMVHPAGPAWLLWATIPASGPLVSAAFRSVSRNPALPAPTRRFWWHLTPVPVLVAAGQTAQAADVLTNPGVRTSYTGPGMLIFDALALMCLIHALVRLPVGDSRPGAGARVALDAGTVALAAAVFIWHFGTRQALAAGMTPELIVSLALSVLAILSVFALAKAVISDYSAINSRGLRMLAVCVLVGTLTPMLQPVVAAIDERLFMAQLYLPLIFMLAARAAEAQWRSRAPRARFTKRPYSVLPYAAVAAVDALLLVTAWRDGEDLVAVAFTAVALTGLVAVRQMTALRDNSRLLDQLDHQASHDTLTGLANRALFQRRLGQLCDDGGAHVALLDLDGFKAVNDTFGHEAGDLVLTRVAAALSGAVRPGDTAARLGGDEFVLLLPASSCAEAAAVADRVLAGLDAPVPVGGERLRIRASIGIACGDAAGLLRKADTAMYAAKRVAGSKHLHDKDSVLAA